MIGRFSVKSATVRGVEAVLVDVEVSVGNGIPAFTIVGMPDAAVSDARERVRTAIRSSGFAMPACRVVVNLAPGGLRKTGSGFDLPIAVAFLVATGQIPPEHATGALIVGELSLTGAVRPVPGSLAYALAARRGRLKLMCADDASCGLELNGLEKRIVNRLADVADGTFEEPTAIMQRSEASDADYADIVGHEAAKRALAIAAAGGHGLLMIGPPGSGKTALARRFPTIMPPLEGEALLEAAVAHSVAGEDVSAILGGRRPFRAPHHSATIAGLVGGGSPVRPGEITLAHHGVLFLDELALFSPSALQALRQPLEAGRVVITRADGSVTMPSRFSLLAATNPCPCGYFGDRERECTCTSAQIANYRVRIGGALLDRIDIVIAVERVSAEDVIESGGGLSSEQLREQVKRARGFSLWRKARKEKLAYGGRPGALGDAVAAADMPDDARAFLEKAAARGALSARGVLRTLLVARTVADMEECASVQMRHIAEAFSLRLRDGA